MGFIFKMVNNCSMSFFKNRWVHFQTTCFLISLFKAHIGFFFNESLVYGIIFLEIPPMIILKGRCFLMVQFLKTSCYNSPISLIMYEQIYKIKYRKTKIPQKVRGFLININEIFFIFLYGIWCLNLKLIVLKLWKCLF